MENKELSKIKKMYGEKFMHLCRELFPTILEKEGLLIKLLQDSFATNSRTLYEDIVEKGLEEDFKKYIYNKIDVEKKEIEIIEKKTPYQLLEEAGYDLHECNSEEEIQSFRKYYKSDEELCTFRGNRLKLCVVFWAVKKDAENIIREDFKEPKREDAYGTSVMGIQFTRGEYSTVSIKNRYNHAVNNPDATYGNDLDRIVPGLRNSFAELLEERGIHLDSTNIDKLNIPNYTVANDGKHYKYNMEENGIYYCPGNIIINHGDVIQLEAEKQILIDYFILDKVNKSIKTFDESLIDSFLDDFNEIESLDVRKKDEKEKEIRVISIKTKNSDTIKEIEIDKENNIIKYKNESLKEVGNNFLRKNTKLTTIKTPNIEKVGDRFLDCNREISQLELPNLRETGKYFLYCNDSLSTIEIPNLEKVGNYFLENNRKLLHLELPKLREAGHSFLYYNEKITTIEIPNLEKVGNNFLVHNKELTQLELPNLREVGDSFLYSNEKITTIEAPNIEKVDDAFFACNRELTQLEMPNLRKVGNSFLQANKKITTIEFPNLEKIENCFFENNKRISKLRFPNLREVGNWFLHSNEKITTIEVPNLEKIGNCFLWNNRELTQLELPNLREIGAQFLYNNRELSKITLPKVKEIGDDFLPYNEKIKNIELSNSEENGYDFLHSAKEKSEIIETEKIDAIDKKDIAELSKETAITTSEMNFGQKILSKIKGLFKKKEENKRGDK